MPIIQDILAKISPSDPDAENQLLALEKIAKKYYINEEVIALLFSPKVEGIRKFKETLKSP